MWKLLHAIMQPCITFGPLFMIFGWVERMPQCGALMLAIGLTILSRTVYNQSLEIKELRAALLQARTPVEDKG